MRYVLEEVATMAREWERRFANVREDAGILFVGVEPEPAENGMTKTYVVHLGLARHLDESTGVGIIQKLLEKEIATGAYDIKATIHRGISCNGALYRPKPLDMEE
jgi:hypothetical protein